MREFQRTTGKTHTCKHVSCANIASVEDGRSRANTWMLVFRVRRDSRPELNKLNSDAHRRQFDAAVVWKFDRFARSVSHLLRALETFQALGIEFVGLTEGVDTSTPAGKMIFTVLGAVAELERSLIRERVRAGLRNAKAKGKLVGRPKVKADIAHILDLRAQGLSWLAIGEKLGLGEGTVRRLGLAPAKILSFPAAASD